MQSPAPAAPPPTPRSFAGLLADFAAPEKKFPPVPDLDGLADDVATLSYEHALRSRARCRSADEVSAQARTEKAGRVQLAIDTPEFTGTQRVEIEKQRCARSVGSGAAAGERKCASITVRLTQAEDEQLRQRSAEAGLTVSAYLRSCAFEVESLRAQVKQTLAELRQKAAAGAKARGSLWRRLWPRRPSTAA